MTYRVSGDYSHEQSLVVDTEKGPVIFNSCSHGGAANIINEVTQTFPNKKIYGLVGGFHLFNKTEDKLLVTDYIDFTEDGTPSLNSEAALLTYSGARVTGEHYTLYLALCDSSNKEKAAVSAEQLAMRDEAGNETGTITANKKNSRFIDVTFPKEGSYTLALRTDENNRVWVIAGYPELSFYTENTMSKEAYVEELQVAKADTDTDTSSNTDTGSNTSSDTNTNTGIDTNSGGNHRDG